MKWSQHPHLKDSLIIFTIYVIVIATMAVRDLPEIYTQSPRAAIPSSHGISDIFHLGDSTPSEKLLPYFGSLFYWTLKTSIVVKT